MKIVTLDKLRQFKDLLYEDLKQSDSPVQPGSVVEMRYEYDGDNTSDDKTWVTNYGGIKMFVKLGSIPRGTLNLEGAIINAVNPSNAWLNYSVEVTEEHLNEVIVKANTDIYATTNGLIQIFNKHVSDQSKFAIVCVCTKAGWYDVAFDDWYEIIYFPETGIYGYDKRTYGGNEYVESIEFTVTTPVNGDVDEDVTDSPIKYKGNEIQVFNRGICIGDSVTEGSFDSAQGGLINKKYSYPRFLERMSGIGIVNAGIAGMTSKTWYEASIDSTTQWGKWVNQEWVWNMYPDDSKYDYISDTLDYSGFDFAIIHLGINDLGLSETSIEETLTVFEWYVNNIINRLKEANNGIKIFLATIIPSYANYGNVAYGQLNDRIKAIVDYSTDTYLLDLNYYSECATNEAYNVIHPTAIGYHKLASEIFAMISHIIRTNLNEFKSVQFINTEHTIE